MRCRSTNSDPGRDAVDRYLEEYAQKKRDYLSTKKKCADQNFDFVPLVIEAHGGGWSPTVGSLLTAAAKRADARFAVQHTWGQSTAALWSQVLSVSIQRQTAKATLRRDAPGDARFQ